MEDFPPVNDAALAARCAFPGYEDQSDADSPGDVTATWTSDPTDSGLVHHTLQCRTPALNVTDAAIANGDMHDNLIYTTVKVYVELLNVRSASYFRFTYMKGTRLDFVDPINMHFSDQQVSQQEPRRIVVHGHHFVPVAGETYCKVVFDADWTDHPDNAVAWGAVVGQYIDIPARYINNHTVECDVPPPPATMDLPREASIELSFNRGQQYTSDHALFTYTPAESVVRIDPSRQYVMGNELVKVYTDYFFDPSAPTARCRFVYSSDGEPDIEATANIIAYDAGGVYCYHPPASRFGFGADLMGLIGTGFTTALAVSSNGIDYSEATTFTYLPEVEITSVHPPFIRTDPVEPAVL